MRYIFMLVMATVLFAQEEVVILVSGMHCPLCTTAVKKALKNVEGVESLKVTLESKKAVIVAKEGIEDKVYLDAVKTTGYEGVIKSRTSIKAKN
ncbi:heavy-metal-associated domain-containing protein [Sulfurospirillum barnesii]|uniref:Cation transport ATPase n=1 Tax=Sulfurospirillum barnesii (strain ATCC 700032 / DSM 10660 / SES-3) TaxID=760154 RepID=I3Y016_SULBS|nr:heavy metal-associated domain-containing protein [Sulfurospirillum barnesii]AFL69540.1 cation transport ATPase [Sulfurospirillum barnesii SES-3]